MDAATIRYALSCGRPGCPCLRERGQVHCPHHDPSRTDQTPSLSLNEREGKTLWKCFNGCDQGEVLAALKEMGLWDRSSSNGHRSGLTIEELVQSKGLTVEFLTSLGVTEGVAGSGSSRRPCVDIPYVDNRGEVVSVHKRLCLDGNPKFIWRRGDKTTLYGLAKLKEIREAGWVIIVEGETDCWTLWFHDLPALGLPGASTWRAEYSELIRGLKVYHWAEPDVGGDGLLRSIAQDIPEAVARQVETGHKLERLFGVHGNFDVGRQKLLSLLRGQWPRNLARLF